MSVPFWTLWRGYACRQSTSVCVSMHPTAVSACLFCMKYNFIIVASQSDSISISVNCTANKVISVCIQGALAI